MMWNLQEGIEAVRKVEPVAIECGYHSALGGSVLHSGESDKDLDIFLYVRKSKEGADRSQVIERLRDAGFTDWDERNHDRYGDLKIVYSVQFDGKRIDFFFI
jgi:hypothetical protein